MENEPTVANHKLRNFLLWLVGTVITLAAGYWLNEYQRETPGLYGKSYTSLGAQIVTAGMSQLEVRFNGVPVKGNIFIQHVKIWNRGRKPIEFGDVISPIGLKISPEVRILDVRVQNQTRPFVEFVALDVKKQNANPEFTWVNTPPNTNSTPEPADIRLGWKILDTDDGATLQVIYEGQRDVSFAFTGGLKSQKKMLLEDVPSSSSQKGKSYEILAIFGICFLMLICTDFLIKKGLFFGKGVARAKLFMGSTLIVSALYGVSFILYELFVRIPAFAPF